jgi:cyclopentanol dehydrogenase
MTSPSSARVALVTGGTRGIGAAIARRLAADGFTVFVSGRTVESVRSASERFAGEKLTIRGFAADARKEDDQKRLVESVAREAGRLDVLVNNAGIGAHGRVEDTSAEAWDRVMAINAKGVFLGTKAVIPAMRRAGGGSIINISSQLGLVGSDHTSPHYSASKGAVRLLTKTTALQYAREGIRVNSVHPGPIETPMTAARRSDPAVKAMMVSRIPLGRYGQASEVAYGVVFLASDEASFVTGSELVIDGGMNAI